MTSAQHRGASSPQRFSLGAALRRFGGDRESVTQSPLAGYAFLSPAVILFTVFLVGPMVATVVLSFFTWDLLTAPEFSGIDNYTKMLSDPTVGRVLLNTVVFTFASLVIHLGLGLALALAVNRAISPVLRYFLRTAYFFPQLLSWAAVALVWKYALDPDFGFVNYYLAKLGVSPPAWLIDPFWAMPALIMVDGWKTLGFIFIVLLAGLQGIPKGLYEAAALDGAGPWRRFWNITIPMLSPTLFFASLVTFIGAFQIFEPMFIMTQGGPGDATRSIVMLIYETGFRNFQMGYASALAVVVLAIIMGVTLLYMRSARYWVHHE
jgi:multiple sugar transport system permease protein